MTFGIVNLWDYVIEKPRRTENEEEEGERKKFFFGGVGKGKLIHEILSGLNDDDTHQGRGQQS